MEMNRREALKTLGAAVGAAFVPGRASAQGGEISVGSLLDGKFHHPGQIGRAHV